MRILFIAQDIGSKEMGMGYRSYMMAKLLKARGHDVRLITANYSHVRRTNPIVNHNLEVQKIEGMDYQFLKCFNFQDSLMLRALNMLYFSALLFFTAKKISKEFKPQIVIASSPQPLIIFGSQRIAKISRAKLVFEVRDIWPLSLTEIGHVSPLHPFIQLLQLAEDYAYKKSDMVISLLSNAYQHMKTRGLNQKKYKFIPNGVLLSEIQTNKKLNIETLKKLQIFRAKYPIIVGYAGAHGIMNALDQIILAIPNLKEKGAGLILLGAGPEKEKLIRLANLNQVDNILFLDAIPKDEVPDFLNYVDIAFIGLQSSPLFKFGISPNKLIDYMGCAKPVLMAIDCEGDPVTLSNCGYKVKAGSVEEIVQKLEIMTSISEQDLKAIGLRGRNWIFENLDYENLIPKLEEQLKELLGERL